MDDLETRMRALLLQLEITSNGSTVAYDSSGGGEADYVLVDDTGRAKLAFGDAPHLTYLLEWNDATDDERRAKVIEAAEDELKHIRKSHADPDAVETKEERDLRIVKDGEGFPAREVANSVKCGIRDVHAARAAAGRDVEWGKPVRNGRELTRDELRTEVWRMTELKMSTRQIASALNIAHGSVRFVLARPPKP